MDIEFDPAKSVVNEAKHGIALAAAESLEWDTALSAFARRTIER